MKPSDEDLNKAREIYLGKLGEASIEQLGRLSSIARIADALADQREEDAQIVDAHAIAEIEGRASYTITALENAATAIRKGKP